MAFGTCRGYKDKNKWMKITKQQSWSKSKKSKIAVCCAGLIFHHYMTYVIARGDYFVVHSYSCSHSLCSTWQSLIQSSVIWFIYFTVKDHWNWTSHWVGCLNFVVIWHFPSTVELYAAERGHKFQRFHIQARHPTNISLPSLMRRTGFFTSSSSEWEPVTCQTTNVRL